MISIKSEYEISLMKQAGLIVYQTHQYLKDYIKEGITTAEIDKLANDFMISKGATSSVIGYEGYPAHICTSINREVVHGIPSPDVKLRNGDIISIDICACYKGYHGDSAWTYPVGEISEEKKYLLKHTEESLYQGLKEAKPGARIGDISFAIEQYANDHQLGVVKELVGHGVGSKLHEDPDVPNYGKKNKGPILKPGMTIAVEPMLTLGSPEIFIEEDDWTIVTGDKLPSAHFEHTILITDNGYQILTGDDYNE